MGNVFSYLISIRTQGANEFGRLGAQARSFEHTWNNAFNRMGRSVLYNRAAVKSLGGTSWQTFDAISRGSDNANKNLSRVIGTLAGAGMMGGFIKRVVQANSELQTNEILFTAMIGNGQKAGDMMERLQNNAARYGQNMSEVFKASKGLYSAMAFRVGRDKVKNEDVEKLLTLTEVLSSLDVENRGLSWTAFSIKELLQGQGMQDFKSLINRLEVSLPKETKDAMVKATKEGNITKMAGLLEAGLRKAGVSEDMLRQLMQKGFAQNISRLGINIDTFFQRAFKSTFYSFADFLFKLNEGLTNLLSRSSAFSAYLAQAGERVNSFIRPMTNAVDWFFNKKKSDDTLIFMNRLIVLFEETRNVVFNVAKITSSFFGGLFGFKADWKSISDMVAFIDLALRALNKRMESNMSTARRFGEAMKNAFLGALDAFLKLVKAIKDYVGGTAIAAFARSVTPQDTARGFMNRPRSGLGGSSLLDSGLVVGSVIASLWVLNKVLRAVTLPLRLLGFSAGAGAAGGLGFGASMVSGLGRGLVHLVSAWFRFGMREVAALGTNIGQLFTIPVSFGRSIFTILFRTIGESLAVIKGNPGQFANLSAALRNGAIVNFVRSLPQVFATVSAALVARGLIGSASNFRAMFQAALYGMARGNFASALALGRVVAGVFGVAFSTLGATNFTSLLRAGGDIVRQFGKLPALFAPLGRGIVDVVRSGLTHAFRFAAAGVGIFGRGMTSFGSLMAGAMMMAGEHSLKSINSKAIQEEMGKLDLVNMVGFGSILGLSALRTGSAMGGIAGIGRLIGGALLGPIGALAGAGGTAALTQYNLTRQSDLMRSEFGTPYNEDNRRWGGDAMNAVHRLTWAPRLAAQGFGSAIFGADWSRGLGTGLGGGFGLSEQAEFDQKIAGIKANKMTDRNNMARQLVKMSSMSKTLSPFIQKGPWAPGSWQETVKGQSAIKFGDAVKMPLEELKQKNQQMLDAIKTARDVAIEQQARGRTVPENIAKIAIWIEGILRQEEKGNDWLSQLIAKVANLNPQPGMPTMNERGKPEANR